MTSCIALTVIFIAFMRSGRDVGWAEQHLPDTASPAVKSNASAIVMAQRQPQAYRRYRVYPGAALKRGAEG
ncbi:hypothetical protein PSEUDO8Z_100207 [Pseudomonas sp. 8Z]|nr:hypothetical protein PSEUDO8Z_100207 [Pseudomonas sp. 8Z]